MPILPITGESPEHAHVSDSTAAVILIPHLYANTQPLIRDVKYKLRQNSVDHCLSPKSKLTHFELGTDTICCNPVSAFAK